MKLGTRGSRLARWQAEWVQRSLSPHGIAAEIVVIATRGDAEVDRPLHELEGKGFFTKEIEDALLAGRIDVAVHSLKDLPTQLQARVGTSSLRRITQVRYLRPDLELVSLRGNVPTRVRKVEAGDGLDAALLALAGLERLGLGGGGQAVAIDPLEVMPAPGQGALGLEIRAADRATRDALQPLEHEESARAVAAERAVLAALGGGCQAPVAAYVERKEHGAGSRLYGRVTASDGSVQLTASRDIDLDRPEAAGEAVARLLEAEGAASLLAR